MSVDALIVSHCVLLFGQLVERVVSYRAHRRLTNIQLIAKRPPPHGNSAVDMAATNSPRKVLAHKDPADRFLEGTAKLLDLILATQDPHLLGLGDSQTPANR